MYSPWGAQVPASAKLTTLVFDVLPEKKTIEKFIFIAIYCIALC